MLKKTIQKALQSCSFDPRKAGPLAVIIDANDCKYWEMRAIEQLKEIHNFNLEGKEAAERIRITIQLLLLSLGKRDEQDKEKAKT